MCGIIITKDKSRIDSIKHRGIQYNSFNEYGWIYGHHRLPIQTLEEDRWIQPVIINNGFFLYNGEIFNYDKSRYENDVEYLKDFFSSNQHRDANYFIEEVNKWDGFWSIVLIDFQHNLKIAFTDPLGKKQLYYNTQEEISSEIKGLSITGEIDEIYVSDVRKWGYNTDDRTIFKDVKRILPNKIYYFEGEYTPNPPYHEIPDYYNWEDKIKSEKFYHLIENSVERRLISKKYKISTLFSGGLDSTIILYFLRKLGADFNIYSIENETDGKAIRFMEKEWGLNINYLSPDIPNLPWEEKMKIYSVNDGPIDLGSVIPQYYLFKDIKDKIVLTGDGSDELFGGYRRIDEYDSQKSDVFKELTYYHLPRIDRMSMNFTIECRNPFLGHDIIKKALKLPYSERIHKKIIKEEFRGIIPDEIIDRKKEPLKIKAIRKDEKHYRNSIINEYLSYLKLSKISSI